MQYVFALHNCIANIRVEFYSKCSDFYHPNDEGGLIWNDPDIGVEWPLQDGVELIFSDKDTKWGGIKEF